MHSTIEGIAKGARIVACTALLCTAGTVSGTPLPADGRTAFRFAVLGDSQPHSAFAMRNRVYEAILDRINQLDVDFTVNVGDVVSGYCGPTTFKRQVVDFMESSKKLKASYHIAFGNHDMSSPDSATVLKEMLGQPLYSSFSHKGALFILLNSNIPGQKVAVREKQYAWLTEELARNADKMPIFVFIHNPVFPWQPWDDNMAKSETEKLHALFLRYGVAAVFSGHQHFYHADERDGIGYYITGGGGGPRYRISDQSFYHFLLVTVRDGKYQVEVQRVEDDATSVFIGGVEMESPYFLEPLGFRTYSGMDALKPCELNRAASSPADELFEEGLKAQREGDTKRALEKYRAALSADATMLGATHNMAVVYAQRGMSRDAEASLLTLIGKPSAPGEARYNLAIILAAEGHAADALKVLDEGLAGRPENPWCRVGIAFSRAYMSEYAAAESELEAVSRQTPLLSLPRCGMAGLLLSRKEYDRAIAQCRIVLAKNPKDPEALLLLGDALALKGDLKPARKSYERILDMDPGNVVARIRNGNLRVQMRDLDGAAQEYRKALTVKGDSVPARYNCALVDIRKSMELWARYPDIYRQKEFINLDEILAMLKSLLAEGAQGPLRALVLNNMAVTLCLGGFAEAEAIEQYLKEADAIDGTLPEIQVNLGNIYWETKLNGLAGLSYLKALKCDPGCDAARYNLATLLVLDGKLDEGIEVYRELLDRTPSFCKAWNSLAEVYMTKHKNSPGDVRYLALAFHAWQKSCALNQTQEPVCGMVKKLREENPGMDGGGLPGEFRDGPLPAR